MGPREVPWPKAAVEGCEVLRPSKAAAEVLRVLRPASTTQKPPTTVTLAHKQLVSNQCIANVLCSFSRTRFKKNPLIEY